MSFRAQVIPSKGETIQSVTSTYINSITTTGCLPTDTTFKEKGMDFQRMVKCLGKRDQGMSPNLERGGISLERKKYSRSQYPLLGG